MAGNGNTACQGHSPIKKTYLTCGLQRLPEGQTNVLESSSSRGPITCLLVRLNSGQKAQADKDTALSSKNILGAWGPLPSSQGQRSG